MIQNAKEKTKKIKLKRRWSWSWLSFTFNIYRLCVLWVHAFRAIWENTHVRYIRITIPRYNKISLSWLKPVIPLFSNSLSFIPISFSLLSWHSVYLSAYGLTLHAIKTPFGSIETCWTSSLDFYSAFRWGFHWKFCLFEIERASARV